MKKYRTEDGYTFYLLPDGTVADSVDPAEVDMSWDTFADFWESTEGTAIEVTD
jgi:hypothetical protein